MQFFEKKCYKLISKITTIPTLSYFGGVYAVWVEMLIDFVHWDFENVQQKNFFTVGFCEEMN